MSYLKQALLLVVLAVCSLELRAQTDKYKAFKVDLSIGFGNPPAVLFSKLPGVSFTLEPHYRLGDALAIGLRFESAALPVGKVSVQYQNVAFNWVNSVCPTLEYYIGHLNFRPFIGIGYGWYNQRTRSIGQTGDSVTVTQKPFTLKGYCPEAGFEYKHLRIAVQLNILSARTGNYLEIKIGRFIGGGKKTSP